MPTSGTSTPSISILYVDDEPDLLKIGRIFLEKSGNIAVSTCENADQAKKLLIKQGFDVIVSDYQMPGMDGLRFLQYLRKIGNQTPFIIFTGKGREDVVIEALNSGADFYLQKGGEPKSLFAELSNKIMYAVARRRSEIKLAHTFDLMRYIIEHNNASVAVHDLNMDYIFVSQRYLDTYGITNQDVIGRNHYDIFPDLPDKWRKIHQKVLAGEGVFSADDDPYPREDGTLDWTRWECRPWFEADGTIGGLIVYTEIITERKLKEEEILRKNEELSAAKEEMRSQLEELIATHDALKVSNEYLGNLITHANAPIIVWDQKCRITKFNDAFGKLTGISPDKAIGRELMILFPEEKKEESMDLIKRAMEGEMLDVVEIPIQHQSGKVRTVIWNSANIRGSDGKTIIATIAQGQDITKQKLREEEILRKNEELAAAEEEMRSQLEELIATHDALEESNEYLGNLITHANAPIIVWDQKCRITKFNEAFGKLTGISPDKAIGRELTILFPEEKKEESMDLIKRAMEGEMLDVVEISIQHQSGKVRTVIWNSANIRGSDGKTIIATIAQGQDITKQKKLEKGLQRSRNRYRSLISNVPGVVYRCLLDSDWTMMYLNDDIEAITGYPGSDFIQNAVRTYASIIHPDDSTYVDLSINEAVRADEPWGIEYRINTRNGDTRWVYENGRAAVDGDGDTRVLDGIIIDITDKKEAEEKVKNEQAFIKTLLETSSAFFVAIGEDGTILKMNGALLKALEYRKEDIIGQNYLTAVVPEEEHRYLGQIFSRIMNSEETTINQNHIISRTGNKLLVEWHGRQASSGEMAPGFIVGVGIDITGRIKAEDSLKEANRKLSLLSSITRHDILNKIMTIKGYLAIVGEKESDEEILKYLEQLKTATDAIERQIEFTRQYDQIAVNEPEWNSLSGLLEEIDDSLLPITAVCDPVLIYAEPMIGKVFMNLYDNALRHAEGATGITIRCREADAGLLISWEDDGAGIPYDQKEKIFESGYGKHTGFGLFLVREILDITGITISETGVPGEGARFEILVPKGGFRIQPSKEKRISD